MPDETAAARKDVERGERVDCLVAVLILKPGKPSCDFADSDLEMVGDSSGIKGVPLPYCNLRSISRASTTISVKLEKISVMPFRSIIGYDEVA